MADSLDADRIDARARWAPRRWGGRAIQALVVVAPLSISLLTAWLLAGNLPSPSTWPVAVGRWVGIALLSTVALVAADRVFRRLLPLATLLKLTLTFPDRAPSRFRIALRTGTTRQLRRRIEAARAGKFGDTPAEAAELVLELVAALSMHDRLTRGHSERVRAYTQMIGEEMGLDGIELDRLRWAGLLHDIGKLLVPTEILNKPGKLTDDEFGVIKLHPEYGRHMVAPLTPWLGEAARAVWEHHERWDGGGYPRGIAGTDIAHAARIVSVADTYDVITSVRSYKQRTSAKEARAELARCAGTQFDPTVVRAFLNISVYPIGRLTAPASWATQVSLFPASVFSTATRGVLALGVAVGASAAAIGVAGAIPLPRDPGGDDRLDAAPRGSDDDSDGERGRAGADRAGVPADDGRAPAASGSDAPDADPSRSVDGDDPADSAGTDPVRGDGAPPALPGDSSPIPSDVIDGIAPPPDTPGFALPPISGPNVGLPPLPNPPPTTLPGVTLPPVPSVTLPGVTLPGVTLPPIPEVTVPGVTLPPVPDLPIPPGVTLPPVTVPDPPPVTVPPVTVPDLPPPTVPSVTVPPVTVPPVTVPGLPPPTVPPVTVPPPPTVPPVTVPPTTVPPPTVPPPTVPPPPVTTTTTLPLPPPPPLPPLGDAG